ncbi:MAG: AAA family ATPase [Chloroflexi bacterium]|nr:AAA family ATPase [Chloroflexota bacterium]
MDGHRERRLVTCLFVDIVGSTETTLRLAPEQAERLLGDAFDRLSSIVAAEGGVVEKYIGDAICAIFGARTARADDAVRALLAADRCARAWADEAGGADGVAVRIGVETGEALVDLDAIDDRQRIAVGACVNTAARLQQHAEPGETLVGPGCHAVAAARGRFDQGETLSLKGIGAVDTWRLIEVLAQDPVEVPFVGREAEMGALEAATRRARDGTATLAIIIGPPGQGKSRLAAEAIRHAAPPRVIEARCRPGTEAGSNTPLLQLLAADVPEPTVDAVRDRLNALLGAPDADEVSSAVCHGAGVAPDERILALPQLEQRDVIASAWRRYLAALAGDDLLAVRIEDIHWADSVLLREIDLATTDVRAPVLVIATARPEVQGHPSLRNRPDRIQVELQPLGPDAATRLARLAGDADAGSAGRAAGNPLFIIELARAGTSAESMPLTIQAAIAARLDELGPSERNLLQRVSIVGETFEIHDAALLAGTDPASVAAALGRMMHLGFVGPAGSQYRFHHALVRDVAYGRLPVPDRMALHARYASEGVDPADVAAQAHHWWEALGPSDAAWVWEDAARLAAMRRLAFHAHLAAGRRLADRNVYEEAVTAYERALVLADEPAATAEAERRIGEAYAKLARGDEAWEHALRAIEVLRESGADVPAAQYVAPLAIATWNWGYFQGMPSEVDVLAMLAEGEAAARTQGDDAALAQMILGRGAFTEQLTGIEEVEVMLRREPEDFADAIQRLAQLYMVNGRIGRAVELYQMFEDLVARGAVISEPEAMLWYAVAVLNAGDAAHAARLADKLMAEATQRSAHTKQHGYGLAALVSLCRGEFDDVIRLGDDIRALVAANRDSTFCLLGSVAMGYHAIAEILAGRPSPADIDEQVLRMVPASGPVQASSVMVPKVMTGDEAALTEGLKAYQPGIPLRDRARVLDVCDLMPAAALTILERWEDLEPVLERLDAFNAGGALLAGAVATAIREEHEHRLGGPRPQHDELNRLGFAGLSTVLSFRPGEGDSSPRADLMMRSLPGAGRSSSCPAHRPPRRGSSL